ncbi:hypothetical protein C357_00984 [Citreicella sp. 357]|nr:hypothetical protein C357_00984 [Citreicella sp. 357]
MIWFVNMQDKFLSRWGKARNGRALYCIRCTSYAEAERVTENARKRSEMKRVVISRNPRRTRPGDQRTIRDVSDLGEVWTR